VEYSQCVTTVLEDTDQHHHHHYHQQLQQKNYMMQSQQHFLKKQYREALEYGNLFFENAADLQKSSSKREGSNENDVVVHLTPTILIPPRPRRHPTTTGWTTSSSRSNSNNQKNTVKSREYSFAVSLSVDHTAAASSSSSSPSSSDDFVDSDPDQMASIVLQSWHELSKKEQHEQQQLKAQQQQQQQLRFRPLVEGSTRHHNGEEEKKEVEDTVGMTQGSIAHQQRLDRERSWMFLMPMLDYYNNCRSSSKSHQNPTTISTPTTKISLDLFLVWIPFWESHQQSQHAFEWTVQVLREYYCFVGTHYTNATTTSRQQKQLIELLWLHCICNQLPYIKTGDCDGSIMTSPIEELIISITPTRYQRSNVNTTISTTPHQHSKLAMNNSMMTQVDSTSVVQVIDTLDVLLCSITSAASSKDQHQEQQQQTMMITKKTIERAHRWVSELMDTESNNSTDDTKSAAKSESQRKENPTSTTKKREGDRTIKRRKSVTFASDNNTGTTTNGDADTATETRADCDTTDVSSPGSSIQNNSDLNDVVVGASDGGIIHQYELVLPRREQFEVYCRNVVDWIQRLFLQFVLKIKITTASLAPPSLSSFTSPSDLLQQGLRAILGDGTFSLQRDASSATMATSSLSTATTLISSSLQSFVRRIKENQQLRQRVAFIVLMVLLSMKKSIRRRARQVATQAAKSVATTVILAPIREVIDALGLSMSSSS